MKRSHNEKRNILISVLQGKIVDKKKMKKIANRNSPDVVIISPYPKGKYFTVPGSREERSKEISLSEIEILKEDHDVIFLTRAEGNVLPGGKISRSEDKIEE
jgi:hypothetical protein